MQNKKVHVKLWTPFPEYKKIYYNQQLIKHGSPPSCTRHLLIFEQTLGTSATQIRKKIEKMVNLPFSSNMKLELQEIISSLNSCGFLSTCESLLLNELNNTTSTTLADFGLNFNKFIEMHNALSSFELDEFHYESTRMTHEEIAIMKSEQEAVIADLKKRNVLGKNRLFYLNNIEYRIRNGELIC